MNLPRLSPRIAGLLGLSAINVVLLAGIVAQFEAGEMRQSRIESGLNVSDLTKEIPVRKPFDAYDLILARPIFFKSRTPFVAPPPILPPASPVPMPVVAIDPGLAVGGVMLKNGLSKAFLFSKNGSAAGTWASEGDEFQGWRVRSIDSSGVKVEQGGRSVQLSLYPVN